MKTEGHERGLQLRRLADALQPCLGQRLARRPHPEAGPPAPEVMVVMEGLDYGSDSLTGSKRSDILGSANSCQLPRLCARQPAGRGLAVRSAEAEGQDGSRVSRACGIS